MHAQKLEKLGRRLAPYAIVNDPFDAGLKLKIYPSDRPEFVEWQRLHLPSPTGEFSRRAATAGVRLGRGFRRAKGGAVSAQRALIEQATEAAASEVDWDTVHDIEVLKDGLPLLFEILEGGENTAESRRLLLDSEPDVLIPAATTPDGEDVWRRADVTSEDEEIPYGGEGYHDGFEVKRPSIGSVIAAWIYSAARDRSTFRAAAVEDAAELLDPTPGGGTASEAA